MRPLHHGLYDESVPASIKEAQLTQQETPHRVERDSMGEVKVPRDALFGAQTRRALDNFPVSDLRFQRRFIQALGAIKLESANVNNELGLLEDELKDAIVEAAEEVTQGRLDNQFVLDIFQTGSGTSTNMNANEVISNRAIQILEGELGSKSPAHPNDHVNQGQSSNDVIPTAIHLSALVAIKEDLLPGLRKLQEALDVKAREFDDVVKTGRTHLQDATPIRLGQEFRGYAGQIERGLQRIDNAVEDLAEVALGGTAVGTGVNTHPDFASRVCERLSSRFGIEVRETENHFQAESTTMVAAQVIGNDVTIALAGGSGNFELNVMLPVIAYNLIQSIEILGSASANLADQCVSGLQATDRGPELVEQGLMLATALAPVVGYDKAAEISKQAYKTGKTIREVARESTDLSEVELDSLLDARKMT